MRTALAFALLSALAAAPWAACLALGWDAEVGVITNGPITGVAAIHAATAVVARCSALLVAPIPAIAAVVRLAAPAVFRWTAARTARTLPA